MAPAKHRFQRLVFNPAKQKLIDFLHELQKSERCIRSCRSSDHRAIHIYARVLPHLKKSTNLAHSENSTYERIVSHIEWGLELEGLEAPNELQINTVTQQATQQYSEKP